jgi:uncharacterized protein (DUF58 family)
VRLPRLQVQLQRRFYLVVALMAFSLLSGLATRDALSYRLFYVLAITVALAYVWNRLSVRSITLNVGRRTSQARVGDTIEEELSIESQSRLPKLSLEVRDVTDLPGYSGGAVVGLSGNLSGYARSNFAWTMRTPARKRGLYRLGPVQVSNTDPFGLFHREETFGEEGTVTVYPRIVDLSGFDILTAESSGDGRMRKRTHNVTPHASTVRDYAFGDSLSRIHWNSTARLGKLMSKEFDLGRSGELWVIIDMEQKIQAGELDESTDEYGVTLGASLAKMYLEEATIPVGLIAYGDKRYFLEAETGAGQFNRIMDYLAMSKAEGTTPLEIILATEQPLWDNRSALIVVTSSPRKEWAVGLRDLAGRGVRIGVALMNAKSFGGTFETSTNLEQLNRLGVPTYEISKGDDLAAALSRRGRSVNAASRQSVPDVGAPA